MAIYHLHTKHMTRSKGHSAVAAASYRTGEKLVDERENRTYDYTRKQNIKHCEIITPDHAPSWTHDRQTLWNEVEAIERRKDSRVAREVEVALPRELGLEEHKQLLREFIKENFTNEGMVADVAIHHEKAGDGGNNPHAHILLTTRAIEPEGFAAKKNTTWDKKASLQTWRESWADKVNEHLENADSEQRIDHRSYEDQGIELTPTQHMGKNATALERQGIETEIGKANRMIEQVNRAIRFARESIGQARDYAVEFYHYVREPAQERQQTHEQGISR